ncbi:MAG: alpha/beta hydrolase [Hyphomicrobiales bacterium]|nr:alpha/beta hydrolase [Hyphomicrobiales bacterium]
MSDLGFIHRFERGESPWTLLLLHGTGGDEHDLIELGRAVAPGWSLLSPRGKVLENGAPRFFRRLAEGVFDEADLRLRAHELADFIARAATEYALDPAKIVALGYSNGANIASATLLLRPETLRGAALLRPMTPFSEAPQPNLAGKSVLIAAGDADPIAPSAHADGLKRLFEGAGAHVQVTVASASHGLTQADVATVAAWLKAVSARRR